MHNEEDWQRFEVARNEITQESHLLWLRFTAFAAMHAGLFALVSSVIQSFRSYFIIFGVLLAVLWYATQVKSRWYENRFRTMYNELAGKLGMPKDGKTESNNGKAYTFANRVGQALPSTSDLAAIVPIIVTGIWLFMLVQSSFAE